MNAAYLLCNNASAGLPAGGATVLPSIESNGGIELLASRLGGVIAGGGAKFRTVSAGVPASGAVALTGIAIPGGVAMLTGIATAGGAVMPGDPAMLAGAAVELGGPSVASVSGDIGAPKVAIGLEAPADGTPVGAGGVIGGAAVADDGYGTTGTTGGAPASGPFEGNGVEPGGGRSGLLAVEPANPVGADGGGENGVADPPEAKLDALLGRVVLLPNESEPPGGGAFFATLGISTFGIDGHPSATPGDGDGSTFVRASETYIP